MRQPPTSRHRQRGFLLNPWRFAGAGGSDPDFGSVSLLLRGDGADASAPTDSSSFGRSVTVIGNTQVDVDVAGPFGGGSVLFDGAGDALTVANATAWNLGAVFTLECFVRLDAFGASGAFILQLEGGGFEWFVLPSGTMYFNRNATTSLAVTGAVPVTTSWRHLAVVGDGTGYRLFSGGSQVAYGVTSLLPVNTSGALRVGGYSSSAAYDLAGRMVLRITNGVARYTSAFTPPTDFPVS